MKKILIFSIFIFINLGFAMKFKDVKNKHWYSLYELDMKKDQLEEGDILIFKPLSNFSSSFGHMSLVGKDKKNVDFPNIGYSLREMPFKIMSKFEYREVLILRYKKMSEEFKKRLLKNMYNKMNDRYSILMPRIENSKHTYCSKYIYDVYEESNTTRKKIFSNRNEFFWPEDFLNNGENFNIVELK